MEPPIFIDRDEYVQPIMALTQGYSYAFQLLGYLIWETKTDEVNDPVIDSCLGKYKELLYRNAYSKIYEDLSQMDRRFILAMAASDKDIVPMKYTSNALSKKPNYVSTYKRRLIESGVIRAERYGTVSLTKNKTAPGAQAGAVL